jgi:hypothetical protein
LKLALTRWNYGSLVCSVAATSGRTRRRQSPSFPAWITTCTDMYVSDWALGRSLTSNYPPRNPPQLWPMITLGCCCKRDTAKFRAKILSHPFTHVCFSNPFTHLFEFAAKSGFEYSPNEIHAKNNGRENFFGIYNTH